MSNILIIDSNESFIAALHPVISRMGHNIEISPTIAEGLEEAGSCEFDVVFLYAGMPGGRGIDVLFKILETESSPEVIVVTDAGDPDEAEQAIKMGAWDYLERHMSLDAMVHSMVRALDYRAGKAHSEPCPLRRKNFEEIIGKSPQIKRCLERLTLAANGDANVLITGETGTGKELFARAIHSNSSRAGSKFVVVDCAALPDTLVESTLFGYEKGAFTGAERTQSGLVKRADGGTLFLDEVGELPLSAQKSFLRVLQERRFRQVGGGTEIQSDFRLIAASNRNLDEMVRHHQFRKDLLFRLRAFTIDLPLLRDRPDDIREIAVHHTARFCEYYGLRPKEFSPDFFSVLERYHWPGNVRELVHALDRAVSASRHEPVIFPKHLPISIRICLARSSVGREAVPKDGSPHSREGSLEMHPTLLEMRAAAIAEVEQRYLRELMARTDDMREACRISGLSRSRLYALLKKYGVPSCFRIS